MYSEELKYIKSGETKINFMYDFYLDLHNMFFQNKISFNDFEKEKGIIMEILRYELFINRRE